MKKIYNKLVRDKIPEIIKTDGRTPITRILDESDYKKALEDKLYEEYNEVLKSQGSERIEELADMLEVIQALARLENKNLEDIIFVMEEKYLKRGGFDKKIYLESVIDKDGE